MVLRLGQVGDVADRLEHHEIVLAARRHAILDDVRHRQVGPAQCVVGLGGGGLGRLHLGGQILGTREQRCPLITGGLRDLLAQRLLLGPDRLEPLNGGPPLLVGTQQVVHRGGGLAAHPLAGTDQVGIFAKQTEVNHDC
jgi:hypothetical protein